MNSSIACTSCGTMISAESRYCSSCGAEQRMAEGTPEPSSPWEAILERLARAAAPRYRVERLIGHGGFAGVYLANEVRLGRKLAIKVMAPGLMLDPKLVTRFQQEARTTAQLSHPNIVTVYDVDEREGLHYFVMAYVAGSTLSQVLARRGEAHLPVAVVRHLIHQVGGALAHAHRAGVIHRDVKPSNILVDSDANALVTDFGIAKVADEPGLTRTGFLVGTPAYMSPEQFGTAKVTAASDQYSLGVVTYELLTGAPPLSGPMPGAIRAHAGGHGDPVPITQLRPDVPTAMADAIHRMLARDPDARFSSVVEALSAMDAEPLRTADRVRSAFGLLCAAAASVRIESAPALLTTGQTVTLRARVFDAAGHELAGRPIAWASSRPQTAAVTDRGLMTATAAGSVVILASCEGAAARLPLEIIAAEPVAGQTPADRIGVKPETPARWLGEEPAPGVASLAAADELAALTPAWLRIQAPMSPLETGERFGLSPIVGFADGKEITGGAIAWRSTNPGVAVVDPDTGELVAAGAGHAVITASMGDVVQSVRVEVSPPRVARIELKPAALQLAPGQSEAVVATVYDRRGKPLDRPVSWSSSDPDVATVTRAGEVSALRAGGAVLEARCDEASASAAVRVAAASRPSGPPSEPVVSALALPDAAVTGARTSGPAVAGAAASPPLAKRARSRWPAIAAAVVVVGGTGAWLALSREPATEPTPPPTPAPAPVVAAVEIMDAGTGAPLDERVEVEIGDTLVLAARAIDSDGLPIADASIEWSSSDPAIVALDSGGRAIAQAGGTAAITAVVGGIARQLGVDVTAPPRPVQSAATRPGAGERAPTPRAQTPPPSRTPETRAAGPPPVRTGYLRLVVNPWADIWVDGVIGGQVRRLDLLLSAGRHELRLVGLDGVRLDTAVVIIAGDTVSLSLQMPRR